MAHLPLSPLLTPPQAIIPTSDEEALKAMVNQLDGVIDTVSCQFMF